MMRPYDPKRSLDANEDTTLVIAPTPMHAPQYPAGSRGNSAASKGGGGTPNKKHAAQASLLKSIVIIYVWLALLSGLSLWTFFRYTTFAQTQRIAREVFGTSVAGAENPSGTEGNSQAGVKYSPGSLDSSSSSAYGGGVSGGTEESTHTYPFNIYDDTANRIVRYPQTGGIPHLDWNKVRNFRACCKDDDNLRCFSTEEVALRRDPERSTKGLHDVYLEIKQQIRRTYTAANGGGGGGGGPGGSSSGGNAAAAEWKPIGSRGARCQLVWTACKVKVET